jgi:hypothetical protein
LNRERPHKRHQARPGKQNARKSLPWNFEYDFSKPVEVLEFLGEVVKATWTGELGTRQASALNNACHILLEFNPNVQRLKEIEEILQAIQREYELAKKNNLLPVRSN